MVITEPKFPPIPGMVEDVDENGKSIQFPTQEKIEKERLMTENKMLKTQVKALSDMNDFITECLMEMSCEVYKESV